MANIDVIAMLLSNTFTEESLDGVGALKGVPCQIKSKTPIEGGTRITFRWESNSGVEYTTTLDVMNGERGADGAQGKDGEAGRGIASVKAKEVKEGEYHLIITYDDGTTEDAGKIVVSGGGGSSELESDLTTSVTVGGIASGKTYEEGTSLETIFRDMLNPVAYPSLTNPSATLSATGAKLLESGSTLNTTMTIAFNRGSINPQYDAESPYRSGEAQSFTLDGTSQASNVFPMVITSAKTSYQGSVAYGAGVQPKDSVGNNYNSPLPAGSVNTNTLTYEFVNALYANTTNIASVSKLALVSKSAKVKEFSFPAQTSVNPEEFHVDSSWTITAVEVLNTLSNQWENCASEFTVTDITHEDAGGNTVNYKKYLCNLGIATGARKIRIKWS